MAKKACCDRCKSSDVYRVGIYLAPQEEARKYHAVCYECHRALGGRIDFRYLYQRNKVKAGVTRGE